MKVNASIRRTLVASAALLALAATAGARDAALSDAQAVAAQRPGLTVVRVAGHSMLPYFGNDAVLVIKKIDAARLRVGMIAVYVNRFGEKVAHRVMAKVGDGWEVRGYNNDRSDSTVVNAGNLLGIVYATFESIGSPAIQVAATAHPAIETVYAAPAK